MLVFVWRSSERRIFTFTRNHKDKNVLRMSAIGLNPIIWSKNNKISGKAFGQREKEVRVPGDWGNPRRAMVQQRMPINHQLQNIMPAWDSDCLPVGEPSYMLIIIKFDNEWTINWVRSWFVSQNVSVHCNEMRPGRIGWLRAFCELKKGIQNPQWMA